MGALFFTIPLMIILWPIFPVLLILSLPDMLMSGSWSMQEILGMLLAWPIMPLIPFITAGASIFAQIKDLLPSFKDIIPSILESIKYFL